ncbi:hypothetical protein GC194_04120 [bacterium]|nr:hypothetical protein [bacterium]
MRYIAIVLCLLCSFAVQAQTTSALFSFDQKAIDEAFLPLNQFEKSLTESGATDAPLSSLFEIRGDSLGNDPFPILGVPSFWLVFVPTCASNCVIPCTGTCAGATSVLLIHQLGKNDEESKKALAGCIAGQLPIVMWVVLLILSY